MRTDEQIIEDLMNDYALTFKEKTRIIEMAKNCVCSEFCYDNCPLLNYSKKGFTCSDFFAKFIVNNGLRLSTSVIVEQDADVDYKSINDLMKEITKLANEIKIKTKRDLSF